MLIHGPQGEALPVVTLTLTPAEARELRGSLDDLLAADDKTRHEHVPSADYQTEVTIVVSLPDA